MAGRVFPAGGTAVVTRTGRTIGTDIYGDPYVQPGKKKKKKRRSNANDTHIDPPGIIDNDPINNGGASAELESNGYKMSVFLTNNVTLTVPKTGTVVVGTGSTGVVPQFSDANTISASNLASSGSNVVTIAGDTISTVTAPRTGKMAVDTVTALTPSASITMDWDLGNVFTLTPDQSCAITPQDGYTGQSVTLVITTSGSSSYTLTFSAPFKVTGTLATGTVTNKRFVIRFIRVDTEYLETGRTAAF